jgi:hypothetical protein
VVNEYLSALHRTVPRKDFVLLWYGYSPVYPRIWAYQQLRELRHVVQPPLEGRDEEEDRGDDAFEAPNDEQEDDPSQ